MRSVTFTAIEGIPLVNPGDTLGQLVCSAMVAGDLKLARGDILVVCQKIISKAEGRTRELSEIEPSALAVAYAERHGTGTLVLATLAGPVTVTTAERDGAITATLTSVPPRSAR